MSNKINSLALFEIEYELRIKPPNKRPTYQQYKANFIAENAEQCTSHLYEMYGESNIHVYSTTKKNQTIHALARAVVRKITEQNYDVETRRRQTMKGFEEDVIQKKPNSSLGFWR